MTYFNARSAAIIIARVRTVRKYRRTTSFLLLRVYHFANLYANAPSIIVAKPDVTALTYGIRYSLLLSNITNSIIPSIANCTTTIATCSKLMSGLLWIIGVMPVVVVVVLAVCFTYPKR